MIDANDPLRQALEEFGSLRDLVLPNILLKTGQIITVFAVGNLPRAFLSEEEAVKEADRISSDGNIYQVTIKRLK